MNFTKLLLISLRTPAELPGNLSPLKLEFKNIVEGALFIAAITALLNAILDKLVFRSAENASELLQNSSLVFIFNPLSMFTFELIFISTLILSILLCSNLSNNKVSVEELGKNVLFICLAAFVFKLGQVIFAFISFDLYYIFRFIEVLWFIWALSSVVAALYNYRSVLLTAFLGVIIVSLTMGFLFMIFISIVQLLLISDVTNV